MPQPRTYATAGAFRKALEERLKTTAAQEQVDLNRLRRQVSFDRLLARLFRETPAPWVLKGGYALELRFRTARATLDIDLTLPHMTEPVGDVSADQAVREMLQERASLTLGDWFEFVIGPPAMDLTAAPYGGSRYPVEARLDERIFARFHLDVGIGDVVLQPVEHLVCRDWLGFAGIEASHVQMIAREQQFAEKIHAYTLPRTAANSRVKDLVDLALLVEAGGLDRARLREALRQTFLRRRTHELPLHLTAPPPDWRQPFEALAKNCGMVPNINSAFNVVDHYFRNLADDASARDEDR